MKSKITSKLIYLVASTLFILTVFILTLVHINKKLSTIILRGPFTVEISQLQKTDAGKIKIYASLLDNKNIELTKSPSSNTWTLEKNNCITKLFIKANEGVINDSTLLNISAKNKRISINEFHFDRASNSIDINNNIKIRATRLEFVLDFFQAEIIWYYIIVLLLLVLYFGNIIFIVYKYRVKGKILILSGSVIFMALLFHILFYAFTSVYLVTSGIFLIIILWFFSWILTYLVQLIFRRIRVNKNVYLSITSIFFLLLLIEITLLISGYNSTSAETRSKYYYASKYTPSERDWFHLWSFDHDLKTDEFCFHRTINAERLSDIDHTVKKDSNRYRIIGIGDSFTEGDGADADSTWLKFLQRNLLKYPIKKQIEYINAGVCGSDPIFEYLLLKEKLLKYKPDMAILTINSSDISDIMIRGGMERFQPDGILQYNKPPVWEPIFAICRISRLVFSALNYDDDFRKKNKIDETDSKEKIFQIILKFYELSMQNNFRLLVVFHPVRQEINQNRMALSDVLERIKYKTKINYIDMMEYYKTFEHIDSTNSSGYYWVNDGHHNAKGYAAFARGIEWKLIDLGILDSLRLNEAK
jgi:lysophospholipase L1-like esterase